MPKARVYELAKELGVDSKTVLNKLEAMGEFVKPLLIHGELVPSHRATMFVIPRLFPGHDGTYPHALDYRVQHTQARGLNAHGLTAAESVGYSAVSPLVEACASAIFLACASADSMPIFHPVSLAAKRAFWPSLPMASDS